MKEITDLTEEEADWVAGHVATLERLDVALDPVALDAYLERARASAGAQDPTPLVNLVGAGVGQILAERLGLRWVTVVDKHGTRPALYGDAKKTVVFPLDAVARRWEGGSVGLAQYVAETGAMIVRLRAPKAV
ncbi:DUF3806 domain-containing protein [Microbacterium sulfonylureivorans]|uniref:DUF3806 domain-containing protein n=1 Tax=Microbacterium sulfonylureivorans TaxID=2486854 RepID=UPI0013DEC7CB|nr:DUF3806 domain-containing protein [Microbacterium sulfonylureivorans]